MDSNPTSATCFSLPIKKNFPQRGAEFNGFVSGKTLEMILSLGMGSVETSYGVLLNASD